jgi:hypothetical protein
MWWCQALVYIYSRDSEAEAMQAKVLTKDEARRIAVNVARLPDLLASGTATAEAGQKKRPHAGRGQGPIQGVVNVHRRPAMAYSGGLPSRNAAVTLA